MDVEQLVREHHAPVYRYAYRLTGSVPDAEDLTQQTFLIANQKIGQLRDATRSLGWLFTILRRCFLNECRQRVETPASNLEMALEQIPEEIPADSIDREQLQAALVSLSDEFRLVLVMFYFEDCSYREIAEKLELPIGTVMSRLSRAKQHLRRALHPDEIHKSERRAIRQAIEANG